MIAASLAVGATVFIFIFNDVVFSGVINGFVRDLTDLRFGDVYITKEKGFVDKPDYQIVTIAKANPAVIGAAPRFLSRANVNYTSVNGTKELFEREVLGIDPLLEENTSGLGQRLLKGSLHITKKTVVLGKETANDLSVGEGDMVSIQLPNAAVRKYRVIGLIDSTGFIGLNRAVIMDIQEVRDALMVKNRQSTSIIVKVRDRVNEDDVKAYLQSRFPNLKVETAHEASKDFTQSIREGVAFINLVGYAGLAASGLGVTTILTMIVTSKTKDIGLLRGIGVQRSGVVLIFLTIAVIVGGVGAAVGAVLGVLVTLYFATNKLAVFGGLILEVSPTPDPQILAFPMFLGFVVSILSSLYPAWKASRYQPAEAMRYF